MMFTKLLPNKEMDDTGNCQEEWFPNKLVAICRF